jgi:hypothetical protein
MAKQMSNLFKHLLFTLSLFYLAIETSGQITHSNYTIGYDRGFMEATNYVFDHRRIGNTQEFESIPLQDIKMATSAITLEARAIDEWGIISAGIKATQDHHDVNDPRIYGKFGDLFWMDFSIGGSINDVMCLYAGGQWKQAGFRGRMEDYGGWTTINSAGSGPGFEDIYVRDHFGRTERGINTNFLFRFWDDHVLLRTKYEYNWLKMRGIPGNTGWKFFRYSGRNHVVKAELITYFSTDEDTDYGISIGAQYLNGYLDFGYQEGMENVEFVPRTDFHQIQFSVSFLFAARGIDSGL